AAVAPAFAQDDPPKKDPPAPVPGDEAKKPGDEAKKPDAKPAEKKGRKVDEAAMKALARHVGLGHLPSAAGVKSFAGKGTGEQHGDRSVLSGKTLSIMCMQIETKFTSYEVPGGVYLPKEATTTTPVGDSALKFSDYAVDGKFVDSTKAEPKPAPKAEAPKEKK